MRNLPPFTIETVRGLMFGLVPTVHTDISKMLATDEHPDEVRACLEFLNSKRNLWLKLTDDGDLLDDLFLTWQTLNPSQFVIRASILRLIHSLLSLPTFPWDSRDSGPSPTMELLHVDRECLPTSGAWRFYLETKAWLRDPSVIPEIAATWDDSPNSNWSSPNLRLVHCLAYCATAPAIDLLRDRWATAVFDGDRQAAQLELCLLRQPGISPPAMTALEIERSGVALLVHSFRLHTPHPVLLRYLQPDNQGHGWLKSECLRRPHLRQLCRGPGNWYHNLIRYLAAPQNDLPI